MPTPPGCPVLALSNKGDQVLFSTSRPSEMAVPLANYELGFSVFSAPLWRMRFTSALDTELNA